MKRYLRFLWKKYALSFGLITMILLLFSNSIVYNDFKSSNRTFHEREVELELMEEEPEKFRQYYDSYSYGEEKHIEINQWYKDEVEARIKKDPITEKDLADYKEKVKAVDPEIIDPNFYLDFVFGSFSSIFPMEAGIMQPQSDLELSSEVSQYTKLYTSHYYFSSLLATTMVLAFILSMFFTSLEHMTRYKMFEQGIALDKKWKFLGKFIFALFWLLIFILINSLITGFIGQRVIGSVFEFNSMLTPMKNTMILIIPLLSLFMFVGSFTGNIVGHFAATVPIMLGYIFTNMLYPNEFFIDKLEFLINEESPFRAIFLPLIIFDGRLDFVQISLFFIVGLLLLLAGAFLYKRARYEDSGKFFTIKGFHWLYYILAVWFFASIFTYIASGFVQGGLSLVFFVIFLALFAKIFQVLFKVKIGFKKKDEPQRFVLFLC